MQYEKGRWWHGRWCRNAPLRWPGSNEEGGGKGRAKGSRLVCWCPRPALDAQAPKKVSWTSTGRNAWWFCFLRQGTSFSGCPAGFQEWRYMSPWLPWDRRILCSRLIIIDIWIKILHSSPHRSLCYLIPVSTPKISTFWKYFMAGVVNGIFS